MMILFYICLSMMRKYILQILHLDVYLLINCKLLKITIFPFKSTMFTFLIPATLTLLQLCTVPHPLKFPLALKKNMVKLRHCNNQSIIFFF